MPTPHPDANVSETSVVVRSHELDSFDHVNHAVFLNYLEHGRVQALQDGGFPYHELAARGWGVYVVRIEVDYLAEARLGDRLTVRTWVERYRRTSMTLAQAVARDDDPSIVVVRALVTAVWVGSDRRPMRLPEEVRSALGAPVAEAATHT
jgi:acyl-CoA thioester hydrolase